MAPRAHISRIGAIDTKAVPEAPVKGEMVNIEDLIMSFRSPVELPEGVNMSTIEEESQGLDMSDSTIVPKIEAMFDGVNMSTTKQEVDNISTPGSSSRSINQTKSPATGDAGLQLDIDSVKINWNMLKSPMNKKSQESLFSPVTQGLRNQPTNPTYRHDQSEESQSQTSSPNKYGCAKTNPTPRRKRPSGCTTPSSGL